MSKSSPDDDLKGWLKAQVQVAGGWPRVALGAGLAITLTIIAQAFVLASFFQGWIFDHKPFSELWGWWVALAPIVLVRAAAGWLKEEAGIRASALVRKDLRARLVDHIGRLGTAWKTGQPAGAVASKMQEQVDGLDAYVARYLPQQKLAMMAPLVILAIVFPFNWICGLILLLTAPLIPMFMIIIGLGAQAVQTKQLRSLGRMSGHFLDVLRGLPTLRLLGAEIRQTEQVKRVSEDFRVKTMEVLRLAFLSSTMLEFFSVLAIALTALYLGFTLLTVLNFGIPLTFQIALFVLLLAPDFYQPLRDLGALYHAQAEALACGGQLRPLLESKPLSVVGGSTEPENREPAVVLESVSFRHVPEVPILTGLNFTLTRAEFVAVTGPSGAGKTTLLRLILGELVPQEGSIQIGTVPLSELNQEKWKAQIGWMSQHPRLIADTLRENLRISRLDASDDDLREALRFADLETWFQKLPQGLDTLLGEGGRPVSGGQLRRLALARLALRPSKLLLLDEPTSSLDDKTQDVVLAGLKDLRPGRTGLLLTHHEKPLHLVDRVLTLDRGVLQ